METKSIVNLERFHICAETPEEEKAMLAMFLQLTGDKLSTLETDPSEENWNYVTHYLKGSAAHLGMDALADICKTFEHAPPTSEAEKSTALALIHAALDEVLMFFAQRHATSP